MILDGGGMLFFDLGWVFGLFLILGDFPKFEFVLVKTGTVGTGTCGRRNRPEPNRTVGFLVLAEIDPTIPKDAAG